MRECSHVVNRFAVRPRVSATRVRTRPIGFLVISIEPSISAAFGEVSQSQSYFSIHEQLTLGPPFCLCFVILILAAVICLMQIGPNDARSAYLV